MNRLRPFSNPMRFALLFVAAPFLCISRASSSLFDDSNELLPFFSRMNDVPVEPLLNDPPPPLDPWPTDRDVQTVDARAIHIPLRPSSMDAYQTNTDASYEVLRSKLMSASRRHALRNTTLSVTVNSRFMTECVKAFGDYLFSHGYWRNMIHMLLPDAFRNIPLPRPLGTISLHDLLITKFTRPDIHVELKEDGLHVQATGAQLEATLSVHYKGLRAHGKVWSNQTSFFGIFTPYFETPCSRPPSSSSSDASQSFVERSRSSQTSSSTASSASSEQDCSRKHLRIAAHKVQMRFEQGLKSHVYPHVIAPLANSILHSGRVERGLARLLESVIVGALQENLAGITGDVLGNVAATGLGAVDDLLFGLFKQRLYLNETVQLKNTWLDLLDGHMVMATADALISTENWKPEMLSDEAFNFYFKSKRHRYIRHWKEAARQHGIPVHDSNAHQHSFWHRALRPWMWFRRNRQTFKAKPMDPEDTDQRFDSAMLRSYYQTELLKRNATKTQTNKKQRCEKWMKCTWRFCGWLFQQHCLKPSRIQKRSVEGPPLEVYNDVLAHADPDFDRAMVVYSYS